MSAEVRYYWVNDDGTRRPIYQVDTRFYFLDDAQARVYLRTYENYDNIVDVSGQPAQLDFPRVNGEDGGLVYIGNRGNYGSTVYRGQNGGLFFLDGSNRRRRLHARAIAESTIARDQFDPNQTEIRPTSRKVIDSSDDEDTGIRWVDPDQTQRVIYRRRFQYYYLSSTGHIYLNGRREYPNLVNRNGDPVSTIVDGSISSQPREVRNAVVDARPQTTLASEGVDTGRVWVRTGVNYGSTIYQGSRGGMYFVNSKHRKTYLKPRDIESSTLPYEQLVNGSLTASSSNSGYIWLGEDDYFGEPLLYDDQQQLYLRLDDGSSYYPSADELATSIGHDPTLS